jgi:SAM-dependent methyltransferase
VIEPRGLVTVPAVIAREAIAREGRGRIPEPMAMDEPVSVAEFEEIGRDGGALTPVYEVVARATSRITPPHARIIDLGCGPAHHVAYFAARRPDVTITGLDVAPNMLALGRRTLEREGVADRVTLAVGDMTDFADRVADEPVDLITSVFALHHLPTVDDLVACLQQIAEVRSSTGCAVMLFDLCRLRDPASWRRFLAGAASGTLATPGLTRDSLASEAAAWNQREMVGALSAAGLGDLKHRRSFPFAGFQMHWSPPHTSDWEDGDAHWQAPPMPLGMRADVVPLRLMFGQV